MTLFQNLSSGLSCDLPIGAYQKLHMASSTNTDNSNTLESIDFMVQVAGLLETMAWTCYKAFFCSRPHSKLAAFRVTQYVGQNSNSRCEMCCFQNPIKPTRH